MRQKIYIFGLLTITTILTGAIFKINHWPGAGILLTLGILVFVLAYIPVSLVNSYRANGNRQNRLLYIITGITCFVVFTSMLFKVQHWHYAGILLTIAIPFPYVVFLPVFIAVTAKVKNFNIYNTVFILLLLALSSVLTTLLALNVSRDQIYDSYNLSRDYNRNTEVLNRITGNSSQPHLAAKIDGVIKTVDDYRDLILRQAGTTASQWEKYPDTILNPDSRQVATDALFRAGSPQGNRLEKELESLTQEISVSTGSKELAAVALNLFDLGNSDEPGSSWAIRNFTGTTLSWSLIYLDALKADLLMLKDLI